jgi:LytS/YehU family sensor histidine kinase
VSEAPVNQFGCLFECAEPASYGHEWFVMLCAIAFVISVAMVVTKLSSESPKLSWSVGGLTGFCSVAAACGIAEMFTYQLGWGGESSLPIVIASAGAGVLTALFGVLLSVTDRGPSHG